jgi:hypothetical protein
MMLFNFARIMVVATILSVSYVHMQMQIIQLAYVGKTKEKRIKKLMEGNTNLMHDILVMKSANNLGTELLSENSKMRFVDPVNVVKLRAPQALLAERKTRLENRNTRFEGLLSMLSFGSNAEARVGR